MEFEKLVTLALENLKENSVYQLFDYYHAWEPPFSNLRATEICCIITLESHHYI